MTAGNFKSRQCPNCGEIITDSKAKFCPKCRSEIVSKELGEPILLSDFEKDLIWQIYRYSSKIQDLVNLFQVDYNSLIDVANDLIQKGLVYHSTRKEGLFGLTTYLYLTPKGYNVADKIVREREPPKKPEISLPPQPQPPEAEAPSQPPSPPSPREQYPPSTQQVTVKTTSGFEVCGYACLLLVIFFIVLVVFGIVRFEQFLDWLRGIFP